MDNESLNIKLERVYAPLVGKIISDKPVCNRDVYDTLNNAWKTEKRFFISDWGNNTYGFKFNQLLDMYKIEKMSPWFVHGNLLVLRSWETNKSFEELDFHTSDFWVQVHGLPRGYFTTKNAAAIARFLGDLSPLQSQISGLGHDEPILSYLRLKVCIDISKPLSTGFHIKGDRQNRWVSFKYERLEDFCYSCGKLGHVKDDCRNGVPKGEFGPALRVGDYFCCFRKIAGTPNSDHINLKINANISRLEDGNEVFFKIKRNTHLKKLMNDYCDCQPVGLDNIAFMFDGHRLRAEQTPDELEMEDGDKIYALLHQTGGAAT